MAQACGNTVPEIPIPKAGHHTVWPSVGDWDQRRPVIERLYRHENKTLKDVMQLMRDDYGLNATPKMYKIRIKAWGLDKKRKASEMFAASDIIKQRRAEGKATKIRIRGEIVDEAEICRYLSRHPQAPKIKGLETPEKPSSIEVLTPPARCLLAGLPLSTASLSSVPILSFAHTQEFDAPRDEFGGKTSLMGQSGIGHQKDILRPRESQSEGLTPELQAVLHRKSSRDESSIRIRCRSEADRQRHQVHMAGREFLRLLSLSHANLNSISAPDDNDLNENLFFEIDSYFSRQYFPSEHWTPWKFESLQMERRLNDTESWFDGIEAHRPLDRMVLNPGQIVGNIEVAARLFLHGRGRDAFILLDRTCKIFQHLVIQQHPQLVASILLMVQVLEAVYMSDLVDILLLQLHRVSSLVWKPDVTSLTKEQHPIARLCTRLALLKQNRHLSAGRAFEVVAENFRTHAGPRHPEYLEVRHNIAWGLLQQSRFEEVIEVLGELRQTYEKFDHPAGFRARRTLYGMAQVCAVQRDFDAAEDLLADVQRRNETASLANAEFDYECMRMQAAIFQHQNKVSDMRNMRKHIMLDGSRKLGDSHPTMLLLKNDMLEVTKNSFA